MLNIQFLAIYESISSFLDRAVPLIVREPRGQSISNLAIVKLAFDLEDTMRCVGAPALASAQLDTFGEGICIRRLSLTAVVSWSPTKLALH